MNHTDDCQVGTDGQWFSASGLENLVEWLEECMARHAHSPAIANPSETLSFQQLEQLSRYLAAAFRETWEVAPGARVAVIAPPTEQLIILLAALRAGLVCALIDPHVSDAELLDELSATEPVLVVSHRQIDGICRHMAVRPRVIRAPVGQRLAGWAHSIGFLRRRALASDELGSVIKQGRSLPFERHEITPASLALLGGGGYGERLLLTHGNLLSTMEQVAAAPDVAEPVGPVLATEAVNDAVNLVLQVFLPWSTGATVVLVAGRSPQRAMAMARRWQCRLLYAHESTLLRWHREGLDKQLATLSLQRWWDSPDMMTPPQRHTGFHCLPERQRWLRASHAWPLIAVEQGRSARGARRAQMLPGTQIALASESADPDAASGRLWVYGTQVMAGFWRSPKTTAERISADGWLKTGFLARMDKGGRRLRLESTDPAAALTLQNANNSRS